MGESGCGWIWACVCERELSKKKSIDVMQSVTSMVGDVWRIMCECVRLHMGRGVW